MVMEAVEDSGEQEILSVMESCFPFMDTARRPPNRLLVHCNAGVSRSASV